MKKLILIFLVLFCLTGCANSVEFDFNEDIKAKVSLSFTLDEYKARLDEPNLKEEEVRSRIESIIEFRNAFTDPYSDLFEEKSFATNGKNYKGVYEYTYTYSNFNDNSVLNNCFENFGVQEDEEKLYIFAEGKSKCAPFELIVKAEDRMVSSNENSKDGNNYIWNIKELNNDVYMVISKAALSKPIIVSEKSSFFGVVDLVCLIIAVIIGVVVFVLNKKFKESDL